MGYASGTLPYLYSITRVSRRLCYVDPILDFKSTTGYHGVMLVTLPHLYNITVVLRLLFYVDPILDFENKTVMSRDDAIIGPFTHLYANVSNLIKVSMFRK